MGFNPHYRLRGDFILALLLLSVYSGCPPQLAGPNASSWRKSHLTQPSAARRHVTWAYAAALQEADVRVPAGRAGQQQDDPLESQLEALRQHLADTRASLAALTEGLAAGDSGPLSGIHGSSSAGVDGLAPPISQVQRLIREEQQLRVQIAVVLQHLNLLRPNGGSRIAEAEEHYRAVIAALDAALVEQAPLPAAPQPQGPPTHGSPALSLGGLYGGDRIRLRVSRLGLVGNLAALLLEAERPGEALEELERGVREAEALQGGEATPGLLCGMRFNVGKALAAVGRTAEAEAAYAATALRTAGLDPGCFAKAVAAMTRLPDDLLRIVQSTVQLVEESGLRRRLLVGGAAVGFSSAEPPPGASAAAAADRSGADGGAGVCDGLSCGRRGAISAASAGDGAAPGGDRIQGGWMAGIGVSELGWLYFALAKALDDRGAEAEAVWRLLDQANELQSSRQPYNPAQDWQQLHTLTAVFQRPLLQAAAREAAEGPGAQAAAANSAAAVFVVGLPRSGSTLVETMLSSYPGVWAAGEDTALAPLTAPVNELLMKHGLSQPAALAEFGRRYLREMQRKAQAAGWEPHQWPVRIVDKMLRNLWLIGYIELLLPGACIVHVVRHPLDVALSCYSQPFGYSGVSWSWRLQHIGEQIRMAAALAAHWSAHLAPGRMLTVHYEQLVAFPEASARRLLAHCGLAWDPRVLRFHTANRTVSTASVAQVRRPLYNTSVGRWRKYEKQLAVLAAEIRSEILSYEAQLTAALRTAEDETRELLLRQGQGPARQGGPGAGGRGRVPPQPGTQVQPGVREGAREEL